MPKLIDIRQSHKTNLQHTHPIVFVCMFATKARMIKQTPLP